MVVIGYVVVMPMTGYLFVRANLEQSLGQASGAGNSDNNSNNNSSKKEI